MLLFLTQTVVILLVTLTCGWIASKLGQVRVIGQIIGGIVVGPSIVGRFFPNLYEVLFPNGSLAAFEVLSTLGLILFLFMVGTEIDLNQLYGQRGPITLISSVSILLPFCIAVAVAYPLQARFAPRGIPSSNSFYLLGFP